MEQSYREAFAAYREKVHPDRPDIVQLGARLETDPSMATVWPSVMKRLTQPVDLGRVLTAIAAAKDKADFEASVSREDLRKKWRAEKDDCCAAVETLSAFFGRFPRTLPATPPGQEPTVFDEIAWMRHSLVWATEFFEYAHADMEEGIYRELDPSRKRDEAVSFCKYLSVSVAEIFGSPLHGFVSRTAAAIYGEDKAPDEKAVAMIYARHRGRTARVGAG